MNGVGTGGLWPLLALLYAATYWGLIWWPARWLEQAGVAGIWQALVSYGSALLVMTLVRGFPLAGLRREPGLVLVLVAAAGWTNVAFLLAVIGDQVVRVLILFYLSPLWAALLGHWILGERLRPLTWVMLALGLAGAVVMLYRPGVLQQPIGKGDWLALSAGLGFALTNVMIRRLRWLGDQIKTQLAWLGVVAVSLVMILVWRIAPPDAGWQGWAGAVALGVPGFLFSTLAVVYAVSRMPVQRSSVIMLFEIVVGAVSAWLLADETLGLQEAIGGIMIVGAGLIAVRLHEERGEPTEKGV
ncbi:MAG: DMT family transporter [Gammaproteobacteria bacterium]|nr:MAG: DMT family transporter [Gammaproteobacteria bacterium]